MQSTLPLYAIPGLGMTPEIFTRLRLAHGPIRPVAWIEPDDPQETFDHYCLRLSAQIDHHGPINLIGMSFGGMVAQRLARMLPVRQVVLVSTIKTSDEKPPWLRLMQQVPLYRFHYRWGRNGTRALWAPRFGIDTSEFVEFCQPMFDGHSDQYFRWAVRQIVHWHNPTHPAHTLHLHGDADEIFPTRYLGQHTNLAGGDHFMVYKRADEISRLINAYLTQPEDHPSQSPHSLVS